MVISNNIEKIISLKNGHIKVFVNSFKKTIPWLVELVEELTLFEHEKKT